MKTKICTKCGEDKAWSMYAKRAERPLGIYSSCKECQQLARIKKSRTKIGVADTIYRTQVAKSKDRGMAKPTYSRVWLQNWLLAHELFDGLFLDWVNSGYDRMVKPSVDRIDDYAGYTEDNIQLMSFAGNIDKIAVDTKSGTNRKQLKPVVQLDIDGNVIKKFYSIAQANRELGLHQHNSDIVAALNGRQKTAKGYRWIRG